VTSAPNSVGTLLRVRDFVPENRGQAALEFAILLPLMLTILLGTIAVGDGVAISLKNEITARTVADLASQNNNVSNAAMNNILAASSAVIAPYSAANLQVMVSGVNIDSKGTATIVWSDSLNGTARTVGSTVTVPTGTATNSCLIWGEANYNYTPPPPLGSVLTFLANLYGSDWNAQGPFAFANKIFMAPREWGGVMYNSIPCPTT